MRKENMLLPKFCIQNKIFLIIVTFIFLDFVMLDRVHAQVIACNKGSTVQSVAIGHWDPVVQWSKVHSSGWYIVAPKTCETILSDVSGIPVVFVYATDGQGFEVNGNKALCISDGKKFNSSSDGDLWFGEPKDCPAGLSKKNYFNSFDLGGYTKMTLNFDPNKTTVQIERSGMPEEKVLSEMEVLAPRLRRFRDQREEILNPCALKSSGYANNFSIEEYFYFSNISRVEISSLAEARIPNDTKSSYQRDGASYVVIFYGPKVYQRIDFIHALNRPPETTIYDYYPVRAIDYSEASRTKRLLDSLVQKCRK